MRFENTMTRQFIAGAVFDENTGAEAILASAQSVLAEALGNLRRCVVVGLTEEMDDSINLFANELGFLAPQKLARYNKTESRSDVASLTPTFLSALEHWLAPDFALYEEAQAIFKLHRATLQAKLFGDQTERTSEQIRLEQRRRHLKRYMDEASLKPDQYEYIWTAADMFLGENLHAREQSGDDLLRWTGPGDTTRMYLPFQRKGIWSLLIKLHAATDIKRLDACKVMVDGHPLEYHVQHHRSGQVWLSAEHAFMDAADEEGSIPELAIVSPVSRGEGEFRQLGVPLLSVYVKRRN
jgi:hypothetical protein